MTYWIGAVCLLLVGAVWALADDAQPRAKAGEVGSKAPDFRLNDQDGKAVRLAPGKGPAWTILAFYPKAATPG